VLLRNILLASWAHFMLFYIAANLICIGIIAGAVVLAFFGPKTTYQIPQVPSTHNISNLPWNLILAHAFYFPPFLAWVLYRYRARVCLLFS
jgi:hypothetical protein